MTHALIGILFSELTKVLRLFSCCLAGNESDQELDLDDTMSMSTAVQRSRATSDAKEGRRERDARPCSPRPIRERERDSPELPEPQRVVAHDFSSTEADLVLRCADPERVDFFVFKRILIEGSSVFRDMLSVPDANNAVTTPNGTPPLPAVDLLESPDVVDRLLRLLYPVRKPTFESFDALVHVIKVRIGRSSLTIDLTVSQAADKYRLEGPMFILRDALVSAKFLAAAPVRVYAVACIYSWEHEAKLASRASLVGDILQAEPFDELGGISARALLRLLQLHQTRGVLAMQILNNFSPTCTGTQGSACTPAAPLWWLEFKSRAREELRVSPTTGKIFKA